ncbi:putative isoprenylcysteine alpha-carbonyl methylesterase icmel2 [Quercus suber]|uniref:Isoprenylcysteine alpha-carbonyl methylesterase icmel2 n=1 Tax=Quercus suber TaxID=58331 RepID=A0AAW0KKN2_QUESU
MCLRLITIKEYYLLILKSHTGINLQDPLRGGIDELFDHLVSVIHAGDKEALDKDAMAPPRRRHVPEFLLKLARKISPF